MRRRGFISAIPLALAGCTARQEEGESPGPKPSDTLNKAALYHWDDFPVDQKPRPIVVIGQILPWPGFLSTAWARGKLELAADLPAVQESTVVELPDGRVEMPIITARDAHAEVSKPHGLTTEPSNSRVTVTHVWLASHQFETDRGLLTLPAWHFVATEARKPLVWPALNPSAFWRFGEFGRSFDAQVTKVEQDGRRLTVLMPVERQPCGKDKPTIRLEPLVFESRTAVAVGLRGRPGPTLPVDAPMACNDDLRLVPYQVTLSRPLGARVLVDSQGTPAPMVQS